VATETSASLPEPVPDVRALRTLDSLPRPPFGSLVGWSVFWTKPELARREMAKLGDRVVVDIPTMPTMLVTTSVDDCRAVFTECDGAMEFNEGLRRMAPHERLLGKELIDCFGGDMHARIRRLVMPAFKGNAIRGYEQAMIAATRNRIVSWPVGEAVSFNALMKDLARDVIMSVVFGITDPDRTQRLETALIDLDKILISRGMMLRYGLSLIARGRWLPFRALDHALAEIDTVIYDEIAHCRTHPAEDHRKDCLSIFLDIQKEHGDAGLLDDYMIAAFQRLLLLAGYETTATTLAWVAERLVRHPDVSARLDQTLPVGDDSYIDAVIAEAMRVRPAVPITVRSVEKTCAMNGLLLPAGTIVVIYINALQHRADLYSDAETFNPERFVANRPDPRHWMPFGGGAHHCLGAQFALFESRVLLKTILEERVFAASNSADEPQVQHRSVMTLPGRGAMVTLLDRPTTTRSTGIGHRRTQRTD
jgi:cytochrome P450